MPRDLPYSVPVQSVISIYMLNTHNWMTKISMPTGLSPSLTVKTAPWSLISLPSGVCCPNISFLRAIVKIKN